MSLAPKGLRERIFGHIVDHPTFREAMRKKGLEIRDCDPMFSDEVRRGMLLRSQGIDLVIDVGAAGGRYGEELRSGGYTGKLTSFEPLSDAFARLEKVAADDPAWLCMNVALGPFDGQAEINVSANSDSSSLLAMEERHQRAATESTFTSTEQVSMRRLDSIWDEVAAGADRPFLKLDVQGYEMEVLGGATAALPRIASVQAELSLIPMYAGAPTFRDVIDFLEGEGFRLAGLEAGFCDRDTGELLQADGLFIRPESLAADRNPAELPKLTVITPSLNQGRFIERTINSVLDQGYPNLEYVIVDGGSTDETVEIIKRYEDQLAWWVSEPDEGQTHAINKGLERTTGEIVAYLNSDDYYLPGAFETVVDAFERTERRWVGGAALDLHEDGRPTEIGLWRPDPPTDWERMPRGRHWWLLIPWRLPQPSTFWRRDLFEEFGLFHRDMDYAFDAEFMLRLALAGELPELVNDKVLSARVLHPEAKSATASPWGPELEYMLNLHRGELTIGERIRLRFVLILRALHLDGVLIAMFDADSRQMLADATYARFYPQLIWTDKALVRLTRGRWRRRINERPPGSKRIRKTTEKRDSFGSTPVR